MKLLRNVTNPFIFQSGSVVTVGNFDGVHIGHQALLRALRDKAQLLNVPSVVILFEPQPSEYFEKDKAPARLTSLREKLILLKENKVDYVVCLKFDDTLARLGAESFAKNYIFNGLNCNYLLIGEDFRFGYNREGNVALLQTLSQHYHAEIDIFFDFTIKESRVSSTKIREALNKGDLDSAAILLGRSYSICGRVMPGAGRGRQWGVPTANLKLNQQTLALKGVFCVKVKRKQQWLKGIANIGRRPTVDGSKNLLEIHLLDFDESLYGELLQVVFLHKLRDEVKFPSVDELITQIHADLETGRRYFLKEKTPE